MNANLRDSFLKLVESLAAKIAQERGDAEELTNDQKDVLWYSKEASQIRRVSKEPSL